jgi:hypothetical protein
MGNSGHELLRVEVLVVAPDRIALRHQGAGQVRQCAIRTAPTVVSVPLLESELGPLGIRNP